MIGTREICALLLAGGMGAGSVVGVQHAKPAITKAKASRPAARPVRRAVAPARVAATPAPVVPIADCPTITAPLGPGIASLAPLPSFESGGMGGADTGGLFIPTGGGYWPGWNHGGGGGWSGGGGPGGPGGNGGTSGETGGESGENGGGTPGDGGSIPGGGVVPGVPQPASWVMMIAGFGLVGLALRRSSPEATAAPESRQPHRV